MLEPSSLRGVLHTSTPSCCNDPLTPALSPKGERGILFFLGAGDGRTGIEHRKIRREPAPVAAQLLLRARLARSRAGSQDRTALSRRRRSVHRVPAERDLSPQRWQCCGGAGGGI